jgi:hypothetical protein
MIVCDKPNAVQEIAYENVTEVFQRRRSCVRGFRPTEHVVAVPSMSMISE